MDPGCTMGLSSMLFTLAFLLSGAASLASQAYFNDVADLPCQFTNPQNISLGELVVFWQNQEMLVLYERYLGKDKLDNIDLKYLGRTSFDQDSWTLRLHNIQIKDKGSYQCFVHHKKPKGLVSIHQMTTDLSVLANFSQPEIVQLSNVTENSYINMTCSSVQGYPEPKKMYFLLKTENSTTGYDAIMQTSQDNVTELYNVSISLSISLPAVTSNMTIFCVLQTELMETQLFSSPFHIDPENQPLPDPPSPSTWFAIALVPLVIAPVIISQSLRKLKKKRKPGASYERETIKVEERKVSSMREE
ncbi:T-lymphocyte activation antigen CD86 isoform X1 [Tupaia chinensis]|uniref:T-lymphocyte activation antigen CD86 isoform X1 n=2 Tax=Tupaia chinensis TaxID=246437 RepID=UPI0003C90C21|nr:T-lymphocyte activation antigen CD86 isoform X1 [Tupaia chinensis]